MFGTAIKCTVLEEIGDDSHFHDVLSGLGAKWRVKMHHSKAFSHSKHEHYSGSESVAQSPSNHLPSNKPVESSPASQKPKALRKVSFSSTVSLIK